MGQPVTQSLFCGCILISVCVYLFFNEFFHFIFKVVTVIGASIFDPVDSNFELVVPALPILILLRNLHLEAFFLLLVEVFEMFFGIVNLARACIVCLVEVIVIEAEVVETIATVWFEVVFLHGSPRGTQTWQVVKFCHSRATTQSRTLINLRRRLLSILTHCLLACPTILLFSGWIRTLLIFFFSGKFVQWIGERLVLRFRGKTGHQRRN